MARFIKKTIIVEAFKAPADMDMGDLGNLASGDYLIQLVDGSLHTMDAATFALLYTTASQSAPLTGTVYD